MNAEFKTQWLEALRSGNYEQGRGQLRSSVNRFCCLGVLCDIVDPEGWNGQSHRSHYGAPNPVILDRAELFSTNTLTYMNDKSFRTFNQIADWIEKNL